MTTTTKPAPIGTVYILEFGKPVSNHARYYVGWTSRDPQVRLAEHVAGRGCPLVAHAAKDGGVSICATIPNVPRAVERKIKNRKNTPRFVEQLRRKGYAVNPA